MGSNPCQSVSVSLDRPHAAKGSITVWLVVLPVAGNQATGLHAVFSQSQLVVSAYESLRLGDAELVEAYAIRF